MEKRDPFQIVVIKTYHCFSSGFLKKTLQQLAIALLGHNAFLEFFEVLVDVGPTRDRIYNWPS